MGAMKLVCLGNTWSLPTGRAVLNTEAGIDQRVAGVHLSKQVRWLAVATTRLRTKDGKRGSRASRDVCAATLARTLELEMLDSVCDVDLLAIDTSRCQGAIEHFAAGPTKGWPAMSSSCHPFVRRR